MEHAFRAEWGNMKGDLRRKRAVLPGEKAAQNCLKDGRY
jgi:hypothetical protein